MFDRVRFFSTKPVVSCSFVIVGRPVFFFMTFLISALAGCSLLTAQTGKPIDEAANERVLIANFKQVHPKILPFSSVVRGEPIWVKRKSRFKFELLNGGDSPLVFDGIKVGSESLRDPEGAIVEKEGKRDIEISGPSNALGISGLSGTITIQDSAAPRGRSQETGRKGLLQGIAIPVAHLFTCVGLPNINFR
jgi:hypothetical protein